MTVPRSMRSISGMVTGIRPVSRPAWASRSNAAATARYMKASRHRALQRCQDLQRITWPESAGGLLGKLVILFDGLITNGKFCCVRQLRLSLTWWHRPLRLRGSALHTDVALVGEPDEPDLDRLPSVQPAPGRRAPVGSGLPAAGASGRAGQPARPDADRRGGR